MRFCTDHWEQLRQAIDARGLSALVADSGEKAASNLAAATEQGDTIDNFDPFMSSHLAIWNNAMGVAKNTYQQNPLMMMAGDPEHPEWECPVCFLNWLHAEHDAVCDKPDCDYPKGHRYEWMIDRAADDALDHWRELGGAA